MFNQQTMLDIISSRRRGWMAASVRMGLWALTPVYAAVVGVRNRIYDRSVHGHRSGDDASRVRKVSVPVISVGNLTTGGTGKTPVVIWIARLLESYGQRPVILSRGYRAMAGPDGSKRNDEAMEMGTRLPEVTHLQNSDRVQGAREAIDKWNAPVIVLDDGFQHRRLYRDLDVVLIDLINPFGFGYLLPRGLLREPLTSLNRADLVILTRSDSVDESARQSVIDRVHQHHPDVPICVTRMVPSGWIGMDGSIVAISELKLKKVVAFCGIGNPDSFVKSLESVGVDVCQQNLFADHHHFTEREFRQIEDDALRLGAEAIVCTHKDLVKIQENWDSGVPVYALLIDVRFESGREELESRMRELTHHES